LSARHLVDLRLANIPNYDHFPPAGVMATTLAALTELRTLLMEFRFEFSIPPSNTIPPPVPVPRTRVVLPSLTNFDYTGLTNYLEVFLAQLDTPRLDNCHIWYLVINLHDFQVPQLSKFIDRTQNHKSFHLKRVRVSSAMRHYVINLYFERVESHDFSLQLTGAMYYREVLHGVAQVLSQFSAVLFNIDHLSITATGTLLRSEDDRYLDSAACLELLRLFTTAVTLDVSEEWARQVARALEGTTTREMVAELMPSLRSLCLKGEPAASVARFVALRQRSGRPVTVSS